jgi:CBS domain-containing protein
MNIGEIMNKNVVTVRPEMNVHALAELFASRDISGAPVVDVQGKLLGVVLEESLIMQDNKVHLPTFMVILNGLFAFGEKRFEDEMKKVAALTVEGIMNKNPVMLSPDTPVEEVATRVIEDGIHYFTVVDNGKLAGIVTKKDIVKAIAQGKIW